MEFTKWQIGTIAVVGRQQMAAALNSWSFRRPKLDPQAAVERPESGKLDLARGEMARPVLLSVYESQDLVKRVISTGAFGS